MKSIIKKIVIIGSLIITSNSYAGAIGSGKITQIGGQLPGQSAIYFGINPAPSSRAACSTNNDYHFVIDPTTEAGKVLYSMLLTAKSTNKTIVVNGTGNCILGQPMEAVNYWIMQP